MPDMYFIETIKVDPRAFILFIRHSRHKSSGLGYGTASAGGISVSYCIMISRVVILALMIAVPAAVLHKIALAHILPVLNEYEAVPV